MINLIKKIIRFFVKEIPTHEAKGLLRTWYYQGRITEKDFRRWSETIGGE